MNTLFTLHLAATWMLVGLIWMVQVVVYPQFLGIKEADFPAYHFRHCFRIGLIVVPLMLLEAGTAAWLLCHSEGSAVFLLGGRIDPCDLALDRPGAGPHPLPPEERPGQPPCASSHPHELDPHARMDNPRPAR